MKVAADGLALSHDGKTLYRIAKDPLPFCSSESG